MYLQFKFLRCTETIWGTWKKFDCEAGTIMVGEAMIKRNIFIISVATRAARVDVKTTASPQRFGNSSMNGMCKSSSRWVPLAHTVILHFDELKPDICSLRSVPLNWSNLKAEKMHNFGRSVHTHAYRQARTQEENLHRGDASSLYSPVNYPTEQFIRISKQFVRLLKIFVWKTQFLHII